MNLNFKTTILILLNLIILLSCNESDDPEIELITFLCCSENPFLSQNIDNLDQSNGEINVFPVFTPNGDGFLDRFGIENIDLYSPNSVTLFNLNDEIVYSTLDYNNFSNFLGGNDINLESGTYKYQVVVENEQTFLKFGYVCIVKTPEDGDGFSFSSECSLIDPILR